MLVRVYGSRRGTADGSRASWPAVPDGDLVARGRSRCWSPGAAQSRPSVTGSPASRTPGRGQPAAAVGGHYLAAHRRPRTARSSARTGWFRSAQEPAPSGRRRRVQPVAGDDVGQPLGFAELQTVAGRQRGHRVERRRAAAARSATSRKKPSNPAGLMTSIMRAGVLPAFHIAGSSPRGSVMEPPAPAPPSGRRSGSRSPPR